MDNNCKDCGVALLNGVCYHCGRKGKIADKVFSEILVTTEPEVFSEKPLWKKILLIIAAPLILFASLAGAFNTRQPLWKRIFSTVSAFVVLIAVIIGLLIAYHPSFGGEVTFVCTNSPMQMFSDVPELATTTIVISRGQTIQYWIDENTFEWQVYVDNFWGTDWYVLDSDVRAWFEGSYSVGWFPPHTYWELVTITNNYIVTRLVYHYQNMTRDELDQLWYPDFRGIRRGDAIHFLQREGANCVRQ